MSFLVIFCLGLGNPCHIATKSKANLVLVNFEKKLGLCILVGSGRGVNRKHHPAERCDLRFAG